MISYFGDFLEDATVYIPFNTFSSDDPSASVTITNLADADLKVHKDGSTTQIVTDGATIAVDFDTITGNHLATIDTSAHADYSTGSDYAVRMEGTTVDAGTINAWIGSFSIENRPSTTRAATILVDTEAVLVDTEAVITDTEAILTDTEAATGVITDTEAILTDTEAAITERSTLLTDTEAILADTEAGLTERATLLTDTEAILADTNELQGDWTNTGRLDTILDSILTDAEAILVDTGTTLLADTEAILTDVEAVITDTEAILVDTNELQGDWTNTGRLDTILDAILVDTENADGAAILVDTEAILTDTEAATAVLTDTEAILIDTEALGASGLTPLASGTAQASAAGTIVLAASSTFADNELNRNVVNLLTGTGAGQSRVITTNTNADDTCNITPNWTTTPSTDTTYEIVQGSVNVQTVGGTVQTAGDIISDTEAVLVDSEAIIADTEAIIADTETGITERATLLTDTEALLVDTEAIITDTEAGITERATLLTDTEAILTDTVEIGVAGAGLTNIGTIATCTTVTNQVAADVTAVSGDTTAADNLELQYDTTGLTGGTFPATQDQLGGIANVGSAVHKPASSYTLTTGTQSANGVSDTEALDGTRHEHTDDTGVLLIEYHFLIGSGTPSSVQVSGYVTGNNDDIDVFGYDWVTAGYKQVGNIQGSASTTNNVYSFDLFVDMVGSGGDEGKVDIRLSKGSGLSTALLAVDQIFVAFSQGVEGYDNGAVWADSNSGNTNTRVGIDGVARNAVSTVGAINALLAGTNLHRVEVAPGSSFTFAASQTDELWEGRDWTLGLGGQDITGAFIFGAIITGTGTATGGYEFEECDIGAVTLDNDGHFELCDLSGTFTIGQAGTFTFHNCFTLSASIQTIDFGALGATIVHLFSFDGEVNFTNMAAGDFVHITGAGEITTTTCTGGTIEHDGFFQYVDAGGNVTEQQSDIKVAVDATLVDTADIQTRLPGALVGGLMSSDVTAISTSTAAADNLEASAEVIIVGAAATGTLSTTQMTTDLSEATDDHWIGRIVTWTSGVLLGQSTDITDSSGTDGLLTFTAVTEAPSNTDTFVIT